MNRTLIPMLLWAAACLAVPFEAMGQVPRTLAYQGFLATSTGQPVNGPVQVIFSLYTTPEAGRPLWSELQTVPVASGAYAVLLGSVTPLDVPFNTPYFLGVRVGDDAEMSPRQPLSASPYALAVADGAVSAGQIAGVIGTIGGGTGLTTLPPNGVLFGQGEAPVGAVVGAAGQVLTGSSGAPQWTGSPSLSGNLVLAGASTETSGTIMKGGSRFLHGAGTGNTFLGELAGNFAVGGSNQVAVGKGALGNVTTGASNTAVGANALPAILAGSSNTAVGAGALSSSVHTLGNTAVGAGALQSELDGGNTALGYGALRNNVSSSGFLGGPNIAIGYEAGVITTHGGRNIFLGHAGDASDFGTIRIGTQNVQAKAFIAGIRDVVPATAGVQVIVSSTGQLGTTSSSRRHKLDITDMGPASGTLMKLRPVTFTYKAHGPDGERPLHYGLVAEEVARIDPSLVARSADGEIETVMYQFLPPMLLNEYQKLVRTVESQAAQIAALRGEIEGLRRSIPKKPRGARR